LRVAVDGGGRCRSNMPNGSMVRLIRDHNKFDGLLAELLYRESIGEVKVSVTPIE
jgi:hypothetical protein